MKFRVNEKSISTKIDKLLEVGEQKAKGKLKEVASELADRSPVDTGAWAESFSVRYSSDSGGRMRSSHGRPRNQSVEQYRGVAVANMNSDIESLNLIDNANTSVSFRNRAPHAGKVEELYQVFGAVKDRNR